MNETAHRSAVAWYTAFAFGGMVLPVVVVQSAIKVGIMGPFSGLCAADATSSHRSAPGRTCWPGSSSACVQHWRKPTPFSERRRNDSAQQVREVLAYANRALIKDHGQVVHEACAARLREDDATLDRHVGVAVH